MKPKKFNKNNKRNTKIIIAVVILVGLAVSITKVMSHAYFKTTKSFNIIQGKIPNKSGDVKLAVFVGEDKYKGEGFPPKENYKFKSYECTNGVTLIWDPVEWQANLSVKTPTVCTLKFEAKDEYEEEILKGSYPVIKDGLVPVTIADNGDVTKADIKDQWYSYENNRWANAVILTGTDNYRVGQQIPEEAIESYFVWILKYRYKLFNVEGNEIPEQEIKIEFGITDTTNSDTECVAPNISGDIGTCSNGKWMTHPAFTSLGVNGIWVGKFETGYKGSTDTASAEKNENGPEKVQIKPNVNSWRSITVSNMYNTSFNYKRSLDSHMMKNTEWGAMAYLTNSKYGRPKDESGVPTEVWLNNNINCITGCVGNTVSEAHFDGCQNAYNTIIGYQGSTTNNISGIYDISGGTWEYVMGYLNGYNNMAGVIMTRDSRYYNSYDGSTAGMDRILGDATAETNGWNSDSTDFITSGEPWFCRGGYYYSTIYGGAFRFDNGTGELEPSGGFRIVLSPSN